MKFKLEINHNKLDASNKLFSNRYSHSAGIWNLKFWTATCFIFVAKINKVLNVCFESAVICTHKNHIQKGR